MPTPPDRWQLAPICAQEPTVAQVSTMVPRPTYAPMLTYDGIRIAFGAMNEPLRTAAGGTTRAPCSVNSLALQFANRSEERRVGNECVRTCRCRGSPDNLKKNNNREQKQK